MKLLISCFLLLCSLHVIAVPAGIKNEDGSFKLSEKSLNSMGIKFKKIDNAGPWTMPKEALVKIKFTKGVYRKYEGSITYIIVNVLKEDSHTVTFKSGDLESGDEVAVIGTNFLRLTESDLNSETVDSCAH